MVEAAVGEGTARALTKEEEQESNRDLGRLSIGELAAPRRRHRTSLFLTGYSSSIPYW